MTILGAGVFAATLFFQIMSPMGISSDYYRYIWQGRLSNAGQDNYTLVPWDAGVEKANSELSQDRVDAVKKYLTSNGIAKDRVKTKAFGGTPPISKDKTEEARSLNRRVEMRILKD